MRLTTAPKPPTGSFPPTLRLLDCYFSSQDPLPQKQRCLDLMLVYLRNIYMNPLEAKFRSIKARNARFAKEVLSCAGGDLVMLQLGFTRTPKVLEEYWVLPLDVDVGVDYWRVKKYKEAMDLAMQNDKNVLDNRLATEKAAKQAVILQIEQDARVRKEKGLRSRKDFGKLGSGDLAATDSDGNAVLNARKAAMQRHNIGQPLISSFVKPESNPELISAPTSPETLSMRSPPESEQLTRLCDSLEGSVL